MQKPIVLFRRDFSDEVEAEVSTAIKHLNVTDSRIDLKNRLVVGRYSVLPFYRELERDLHVQGSRLINTTHQHAFIADFHWYPVVKDLTPESWTDLSQVPKDGGPFVIKGATNSRKFEWNKNMFAPTWQDVLRIAADLGHDNLIGRQPLIIRKYVPLRTLEYGLHGLPFANEWRFFYLGTRCLTRGFYWTATDRRAPLAAAGLGVAQAAAERLAPFVDFFVLDVAETESGEWILIEVNDGQMSGLSECSADDLYRNMKDEIRRFDR